MRVWGAKNATVKHPGQSLVIRVARGARDFQWSINSRHARVEKHVLVVRSPPWTRVFVDFDFDHLLDAVNDARNSNLLFRFGRWLCLRLLLHKFVTYA